MPQGYIKEASYLFSDIYHPRKWSKSWVLQSVLQVSSLESKWMLEVPERSLSSFWHNGCPKDTSRKLHLNFPISTFLGSAPSPMCLQIILMESKRTLVVPERSLGGFWHGGCPKYTSRKLPINFQISTLQLCQVVYIFAKCESVRESVSPWVRESLSPWSSRSLSCLCS